MKKLGLLLGTILAASVPAPAFAAFNTALTQAEADSIMNGRCALERGYARDAAAKLPDMPWDAVMRRTYEVLRNNMDIVDIQRLLRSAEAQGAGGNKAQQDLASFQVCLLDAKIAIAEANEKKAAAKR